MTELDEVLAYAERLRESVEVLMANSHGVAGLHLNGDIASWGELTEGGRFEEWLLALSEQPPAALAALKAQWQADAIEHAVSELSYCGYDGEYWQCELLQHALQIRQRSQEVGEE